MAARRKTEDSESPRRPPATSPESRENQLIALAIDQAEKQIRDGTASSQIMTHFLKLASPREKLEREKLENENELLRKKVEQMESAIRIEELYEKAIGAMRNYSGDLSMGEELDD